MATTTIELPVGENPGWEEEEGEDLKGQATSLLILQSLNQSRNTWSSSIFPKFSSKGKSKQHPDLAQPPPHNIRQVGKCDVRIGPHVFPDTIFYEVSYLKAADTLQPSPSTYQYQTTSHGLLSGSVPYSSSHASHSSVLKVPSTPSKGAMTSTSSSAPQTNIDLSLDVPPALVAQVNDAAATNSTLQYLLQSAAEGKASVEQLKALGILIQSVASKSGTMDMFPSLSASSSSHQSSFASTTGVPTAPGPSRKLDKNQTATERRDLVIEFHENPADKWLIPREIVSYRTHGSSISPRLQDISLSFFVPFDLPTRDSTSEPNRRSAVHKTPAVVRLSNANCEIVNVISRWVNDEAKSDDSLQKFRQKIKEGPSRMYLQHRLGEGQLLNQLQLVNAAYPMKPIKPSAFAESGRGKRARARKQPQALVPDSSQEIITIKSSASKRRRSSQPNTPLMIACMTCGQTDVPLLMGGRYCRLCVDEGKVADPTHGKKSEFRIFNPSVYTSKTTTNPASSSMVS